MLCRTILKRLFHHHGETKIFYGEKFSVHQFCHQIYTSNFFANLNLFSGNFHIALSPFVKRQLQCSERKITLSRCEANGGWRSNNTFSPNFTFYEVLLLNLILINLSFKHTQWRSVRFTLFHIQLKFDSWFDIFSRKFTGFCPKAFNILKFS